MKELSIEAKAQAYEKVREKIAIRFGSNIADEIFSQFEMSEDEKIRKEIMRFIFDYPQKLTNRDSWLDWLEKQGEQKPTDKVEPKFKVGQTIKKEGFNLGFTIAKIKGNFYYNDVGDHFPFTDQDNWELVQQNYAWSEEDDRMYNIIVSYIPQHLTAESYTACINWLKSLKDRVQPKQEWSEEDYNEIETIACHLDNIDNEGMAEALRNIRDKYYHIIPQSTWKPSEEQINSLWDAIVYVEGCNSNFKGSGSVLENLYNDLKKLKDK